ncbi:MAG: imidazole glycerol phosphate synthase subunit HisH, partial [Thermaurantiacus sp.]
MTTAIIDYGAGNLRSVANALRAAGEDRAFVTHVADEVARADRILLPGVGAYGSCIGALRALPGMVEALEAAVLRRAVPFLGICVGLQLLADFGHEFGKHAGLGWVPGAVTRLDPADAALPIPHIGWSEVCATGTGGPAMPRWAYFVHSYRFEAADPADVAAHADYGGPVVAAVRRGNVLGVQFHPEKSQRDGLAFLSCFLA